MKKLLALVLALTLVLTLAACGGKDDGTTTTNADNENNTPAAAAAYKVLPDGLEEEEYIIGFRKGDQTLRDAVQTALCEMKADGSLAKIATAWFGSDTTTVAAAPTTVKADATDDSLSKIKETGKLVLGLDATFKPMGFTNENDEIVGFDIDVAKEVCKKLGVELELKGIDWNTKEKTLDAGIIDCIWNGMSYSDKRNEAMNLSEAYMNNSMVFVVGGSSEIASAAQFTAGMKIAVQSGSTAQEILAASEVASTIEIVELETNVECLQQIKLGMVDGAFMDSVVANYEIQQAAK